MSLLEALNLLKRVNTLLLMVASLTIILLQLEIILNNNGGTLDL